MADNIILIASLLTALGVIVGTSVKIYKFIRKWEKWVEEQSEHNLDNYLSIKFIFHFCSASLSHLNFLLIR